MGYSDKKFESASSIAGDIRIGMTVTLMKTPRRKVEAVVKDMVCGWYGRSKHLYILRETETGSRREARKDHLYDPLDVEPDVINRKERLFDIRHTQLDIR